MLIENPENDIDQTIYFGIKIIMRLSDAFDFPWKLKMDTGIMPCQFR